MISHLNFLIMVDVLVLDIRQLHVEEASIGIDLVSLYLEAGDLHWLVTILLSVRDTKHFAHSFVETGVFALRELTNLRIKDLVSTRTIAELMPNKPFDS